MTSILLNIQKSTNTTGETLAIWLTIAVLIILIVMGNFFQKRKDKNNYHNHNGHGGIHWVILLFLFSFTNANAQSFITRNQDKIMHFTTGATIGMFSQCVYYKCTKKKKQAFWFGLGMSAIAGAAKEINDWQRYNAPRKEMAKDFTMTVLGGAFSTLTIKFTF